VTEAPNARIVGVRRGARHAGSVLMPQRAFLPESQSTHAQRAGRLRALSASPTVSMSACQSRARRAAAGSSANRYSRLSRHRPTPKMGQCMSGPTGRRTVKTEPLPGSLATVTSPPIMRASLRVMATRLNVQGLGVSNRIRYTGNRKGQIECRFCDLYLMKT
jgi:hypothetical protein